jgi:hypothetical protein
MIQVTPDTTAAAVSGAAGPWGIVTLVTTPIMLLALVVIAWYSWSIARLRADTQRLRALPDDRRYDLAEELASRYGVPVKDLERNDRVAIIDRVLTTKSQHERRVTWLVFAAFVVAAVLWFASVSLASGMQDLIRRVSSRTSSRLAIPLQRATPDVPFPGTVCLGNPALPPSDGCVALVGGDISRDEMIYEISDSTAAHHVRTAELQLYGLYDAGASDKPQCFNISINGHTRRRSVALRLDLMSISDRLSDEPTMSTVTVRLSKDERQRALAVGTHRVGLSIPSACTRPGYAAFRSAELILVRR